jgi:hypothetical protein
VPTVNADGTAEVIWEFEMRRISTESDAGRLDKAIDALIGGASAYTTQVARPRFCGDKRVAVFEDRERRERWSSFARSLPDKVRTATPYDLPTRIHFISFAESDAPQATTKIN